MDRSSAGEVDVAHLVQPAFFRPDPVRYGRVHEACDYTTLLTFMGWSVQHRKNILIYIQQDATLQNLFYLKTVLRVSGGTIVHHQERKQLYLQHLISVTTPLLQPAASGRLQ